MKPFRYFLNTVLGFLFLSGIAALALSILDDDLYGLRPAIEELRCIAGVPAEGSRCLADELAALRSERAEVKAALAEAEAELARIAAREEELRHLSGTVESFNQFENTERPYGTVTTGVRFASILEPERWERAWCYVSRDVDGPVDPRIDVGVQDFGQAIDWAHARAAHLAEVGISRAQFEDAREHCAFPESP